MSNVVFLRAVNVRGRVLKLSQLVDTLAPLPTRNVGAAGTLIVEGRSSAQQVRSAVLRALPFPTAVMVVPAEKVLQLLHSRPFEEKDLGRGVKRYVSVLGGPPGRFPTLPLQRPDANRWEVWVTRIVGDFVLSLSRRVNEHRILYPSQVVEKEFHTVATTRGWETIERVGSLLGSAPASKTPSRSRSRDRVPNRPRHGPAPKHRIGLV